MERATDVGYYDVFNSRLNRYGYDYQSRIQGKREENFRRQLLKSVYYVNFEYDGEIQEGELVPNTQNNTKTIQYLLTNVHLEIPSGTILFIPDKDNIEQPWMVYYLESMKASGYNRYIMLKMTHYLTIINPNKPDETSSSWAYFYGQEDNMLKNELKSRSRSRVLYLENLKLSFFILPQNPSIKREYYLEVTTGDVTEPFRVTGYDVHSTPGVEFVSVDPVYKYDLTPAPEREEDEPIDDFYWLTGGAE